MVEKKMERLKKMERRINAMLTKMMERANQTTTMESYMTIEWN